MPFSVLPMRYSRLSRMPNLLLGATDRHLAKDARPSPPWPDFVIAAGRRTAPVALAIKARSGGRTRIVQCMWPGVAAADFDLIAVPEHDRPRPHANVLTTVGALHRVTTASLDAAAVEWGPILRKLPSPRIAVVIGGATRRRRDFGDADADALASRVRNLAGPLRASVMMATSPRTGRVLLIGSMRFCNPITATVGAGKRRIPYLGYLAIADILIVTGDSMAMCSEVCATGRPVYIDAPSHRTSAKHARLHQALYRHGVARPLSGAHVEEEWRPAPFDEAGRVARAIRDLS